MKNLTAFFFAMVLCLCTIVSSASSFTAVAESETINTQDIFKYLEQFEKPYYDGDFDLNADNELDVFDLAILKKKCEASEDGVTIHTVQKFQDWLLAKPNSELQIKARDTALNEVTKQDTQFIQNCLSNNFRFVSANYKDETDITAIELCFLNIDETAIEKIEFTNCSNYQGESSKVIAEADGFYVTIHNEKYVLSFKEPVINFDDFSKTTDNNNGDPQLAPALALYDLTAITDLSDVSDIKNFIEIADSQRTVNVDIICQVATVIFSSPDAELVVFVPISKPTIFTGTILYDCEEFIIFYSNEEEGFRIYIK